MPQVLERHWRELLHDTSVSEYVFCAEVRAQYERLVPAPARTIEWSHHPDAVSRMRRDAEKISRWFRDDVHARFPVEALEAFIFAFPHDRRFMLQQELAARQELLAVPMPHSGAGADAENLGRIGRETGEAIIAVSRMLEDGKIDGADFKSARAALTEIDQAVAVLIEMRERILSQALDNPGSKDK
jgi:hypothetical protein